MSDSASPIIIAHVADLHFGRRMARVTRAGDNVRELDIYKAGEVLSTWLAETAPDLVCVVGDVFDTSQPTPLALRHGYDFHRRLQEADIPTVVVGGNHDTLSAPGRPTPLQHLSRYFGCHVALEQTDMEIAGVRLCCVPYRTLSLGEYREPEYSDQVPNLLLVHATVDGDGLPEFAQYDHTRLPRSELFDPRSSLRMLGHIHIHGSVGENAYYSGAPERLTWGEITNTPAVYLHKLYPDGRVETESHTIESMSKDNDVPRPAQVLTIDCAEMEAAVVLERAQTLIEETSMDGALVHLTMKNAPAELFGLHYEEALGKRAGQMGALAFKPKVLVRELEELATAATAELDDVHVPGAALSESYRAFAKDQGEEDLIQLGCQLIAQAGGEVEADA